MRDLMHLNLEVTRDLCERKCNYNTNTTLRLQISMPFAMDPHIVMQLLLAAQAYKGAARQDVVGPGAVRGQETPTSPPKGSRTS